MSFALVSPAGVVIWGLTVTPSLSARAVTDDALALSPALHQTASLPGCPAPLSLLVGGRQKLRRSGDDNKSASGALSDARQPVDLSMVAVSLPAVTVIVCAVS